MKKKFLAILLAVVMAAGLLSATAFAADISGKCGDNLTWSYSDGTLTIQGTGQMNQYLDGMTFKSKAPWVSYNTAIHTVIIGEGVTSIGSSAFNGCSNLTSVTIPTSVTTIYMSAFSDCNNLAGIYYGGSYQQWTQIDKNNSHLRSAGILHCTDSYDGFVIENGVLTEYIGPGGDVTIPDSVTSIGDYAFYNNSSLTSVTIPDSVTSIGDSAFANCSSIFGGGLTSVTIGNGVTSIGRSAFNDCTKLTSVTFGSNVTSIGDYAFYNCRFTSLTIPDSVTYIGETAFWDCTDLTNVTIGNGVTRIGPSAFSSCSSLTSVTFGSSVTSIGDQAFYNCSNLTSVIIPNSVTSIGADAFSGCNGLTSVTIPAGVTRIGAGAFRCRNMTDIYVASENPVYTSVDGVLFNADQTLLHTYPAGKSGISYHIPDSVTKIGESAFSGCANLTGVTIPNGITRIEEGTFAGCSGLTRVSIPASVTRIGEGAFSCENLKDVYYGGSESQWNQISIVTKSSFVIGIEGGPNSDYNANAPLTNVATIHYNSVMPTEPEPTQPANPTSFTDVPASEWYAGAVKWAVEESITSGTGNNTFTPNRVCTHGEIITFLWRAAGKPAASAAAPVETAPYDDFRAAADWAYENGVIDGTFRYDADCTRSSTVTYMWKAAGSPTDAPASSFPDISPDIAPAVSWAVSKKVTFGTGDGTVFSPEITCDRAQIVTFLYRAYVPDTV